MSEVKKIATRASYGSALIELGKKHEDLIVLDADLAAATQTGMFKKEFPERHIDCGIAECNMMGIAAGIASTGKVPFASTFAMFAAGRAYEQVRNSIGYPKLNVKIGATHGGISVGEDGATHQCLEDFALMRVIPGMVVASPSDDIEAKAMVAAAYEHQGPVYMRFGRLAVPVINDRPDYKFELGKGIVLREGKDLTIIANGLCVAPALEAAEKLAADGIDAKVINIHTIKPLDEDLVVAAAKETGKVVTVEEHSIIGGLGGAANEATTIFSENAYTCYDEEAMDLLNKGINPLSFQGLKTSVTTDDSRAINFDEDCKVIISASGMCDAGRIKHHLKHNLWNPRNTILFVGYQAIGTPGRALLEGAVELKLFGETVQVAAEICKMPGISGHADVNGLIEWAKAFETRPKHVFVTHGDDTVTEIFAQRLKEELGYDATAPFSGTEYDLLENRCIHEAVGVRIVKATASPKTTKAARAYEKLLAMGRRLMSVIRKNEGCPNKDLDRFARDIQSLCDKWDRTDI